MNNIDTTTDLRKYRLYIELSTKERDGWINMDTITLVNGDIEYILDIISSEGGPSTTESEGYSFLAKFEDDLEAVAKGFESQGYTFEGVNLTELLRDPKTKAYMNLEDGDTDEEYEASLRTISNIVDMCIVTELDENFELTVTHSTDY